MDRFWRFLSREKTVLWLYLLISLIIGIQKYVGGPEKFNNFMIFRGGLGHLISHQNLYLEYPLEYFDLFLYHPSFCVYFIPFDTLPIPVSIVLWAMFCSSVLFFAIRSMPISYHCRLFFWWFILFELITSLHSLQTNPLIAALGLFTFVSLEKGKLKAAALFPVLAFCIKGYGVIFACLFLFYPGRRRYLHYFLIWAVILTLLPLPLTGLGYFLQVYRDWFALLLQDHAVNYGYSIMGLLKVWSPGFNSDGVFLIQFIGLILFALTLSSYYLKERYHTQNQRMLLLAYVFLWVILFNHAAESSTFVVAVPGVVLFHIVHRESVRSLILVLVVFFFSVLAPSDVYPLSWRRGFFQPYLIKVIPCVIVWCVLQVQLLFDRENQIQKAG